MDPYQTGFEAGLYGSPKNANPYNTWSQEAGLWEDGWRAGVEYRANPNTKPQGFQGRIR